MNDNNTFLYFAYGSNMLFERLKERCPSAQKKGIGTTKGFKLVFAKKSDDGSGKATLVPAKSEDVFGVLVEIDRNDLPSLDKDEKGYERIGTFQVLNRETGNTKACTTYIAGEDNFDESLIPYDWYHALVLAGAMQHNLPPGYIEKIRRFQTKSDPKPERPRRKEALKLLQSSGYGYLAEGIV